MTELEIIILIAFAVLGTIGVALFGIWCVKNPVGGHKRSRYRTPEEACSLITDEYLKATNAILREAVRHQNGGSNHH